MTMYADINDGELERLSELVYASAGINLRKGKRELLRARLGKRLIALGMTSFGQYYKHVTKDDPTELANLLDAVSTNKTSFFRESHHFDYLTNVVLPGLVEEKRKKKETTLRAWSAACSTGQEPYSMAMTLSEYFRNDRSMDVKILATDISGSVIAAAQNAVYPADELSDVPPDLAKRYFMDGTGAAAGKVRVKDAVRGMVRLRRFNLMVKDFPFRKEFDFIFCRNVLIYFDRQTQEALARRMERHLRRGGYLFLGHAESLMNLDTSFEFIRPTIFRKPL